MRKNPTPPDPARQGARLQVVERTRQFASREPVIESVAERICHRFANGALERSLSIEFETRREFIEAVVRRGYQQVRAENVALRRELRRAA